MIVEFLAGDNAARLFEKNGKHPKRLARKLYFQPIPAQFFPFEIQFKRPKTDDALGMDSFVQAAASCANSLALGCWLGGDLRLTESFDLTLQALSS